MDSSPPVIRFRTWVAARTALSLALSSLRAHKLRSFLTLLGVIIGVGSVVLVGAAIEGLGNFAEESTSKVFGRDSFQVGQLLQLGRMSRREIFARLKNNRRIRAEDYEYLRQTLGDRIAFSPYRQKAEDVKHDAQVVESVVIIGGAAALNEIRDVNLTDGRFFTRQEENSRANVAVIGEELRQRFFADESPIGQSIKFNGCDFRVVGVQEKIGSAGGQSQDQVVYIPYATFARLFGPESSMILFAKARPESRLTLDEALELVRVTLRTRYKTRPGAPDNFDTLTPDAIRELINQILGVITAAVVPVTAISLVVGGIVIMNIMLVSVTERTREIGLRKSLGARHSDLMLQFLLEAILLSLAGGAIGLAGGFLMARIAAAVSGISFSVTWPYVLLALVVCTLVGVTAGWYPARRAARMDPVEALRHE